MSQVIRRPRALNGTIVPPGDRSISVRAAILNALAGGEAHVSNYGPGEDCASAITVLRSIGAEIEPDGTGGYHIGDGSLHEPDGVLDAGNSGTVMRLMAGVLAGQPFLSVLTGDASLRSRPMDRVITPLQQMGADIRGRASDRLAPLVIQGGGLHGTRYRMPVASAQVKSCIMLASISADGETVLDQPAPSRDHTERLLRAMGATVEEEGLTIRIHPGALHSMDVTVPADISSAAFWLIAAVCHQDAEVRVQGVGMNPGRTGVLDVLRSMGADIAVRNEREQGGEPVADLVARSSKLEATEVSGTLIPRVQDELPVLALAACFARGTTVVADAEELRLKETDRIRATVTELRRLGANAEETVNGLRVTGGSSLTGSDGESYGDHRMAMMLGIAGLLVEGKTTIVGSEAANVTYPGFWGELDQLSGAKG